MRVRRAVPISGMLVLLLVAACKGENVARKRVANADRIRLMQDAAHLQQQYGRRGIAEREVPRAQWPVSFLAFEPERVWADEHGVFVMTYALHVEHAGIYIRTDTTYQPPSAGDPSFDEIVESFYWYYAPG